MGDPSKLAISNTFPLGTHALSSLPRRLPYTIHFFQTKRVFTCKRLAQNGTTLRSTQSYFCFPTFFPFGPTPYPHTLEELPYKIQFFHTKLAFTCKRLRQQGMTVRPTQTYFWFSTFFRFGPIPYIHSIVGLPYKIHILMNYPEKPPRSKICVTVIYYFSMPSVSSSVDIFS